MSPSLSKYHVDDPLPSQVGLLKVSMLALGLVVGATYPEAFATWTVLLWILFAIPAAYLTFVEFKLT